MKNQNTSFYELWEKSAVGALVIRRPQQPENPPVSPYLRHWAILFDEQFVGLEQK